MKFYNKKNIKKCISYTRNKRCTQPYYSNKLCEDHYLSCYFHKNKTNVKNPNSNLCPICLDDENDEVNIKLTCCNYKYHYRCLEENLCFYSDEMHCPTCKFVYTSDSIKKILTANQAIVLNDKINENIIDKQKIITKKLKKFKYELNRLKEYKNKVKDTEDLLMLYYESSCKTKKKIDNQFKKSNLIQKNNIKRNNISSKIKERIDYMKGKLDDLYLI
jgi:hypothetical protein